jgi:hypothetical protein
LVFKSKSGDTSLNDAVFRMSIQEQNRWKCRTNQGFVNEKQMHHHPKLS